MKNKWELKDIILVGILSIVFGLVYLGTIHVASLLSPILTPMGLGLFTYEIVFGVWFMVSMLSAYIMRKPGVALISEVIAAVIEVLLGNLYGPIVILSGLIQGAGAELGFAFFGYKKFNTVSLMVASIFSALASFGWGFVRNSFATIAPSYLMLMLVVRIISSLFFSTILVKFIGDRLKQSGVVSSYPISND